MGLLGLILKVWHVKVLASQNFGHYLVISHIFSTKMWANFLPNIWLAKTLACQNFDTNPSRSYISLTCRQTQRKLRQRLMERNRRGRTVRHSISFYFNTNTYDVLQLRGEDAGRPAAVEIIRRRNRNRNAGSGLFGGNCWRRGTHPACTTDRSA